MPKRKRLRKWSVSLLSLLLLVIAGLGAAYLLVPWGLAISPIHGSYRLVATWRHAGGQPFDQPFAIAVDPRNGNVIVTDAHHERVVVLTPDGKFIRQFGSRGDGPGQFHRPTGLAVGPDGDIYVADYDLDRVQKFSPKGKFLLQWGSHGSGPTQFNVPEGMAVGPHGHIYVSDFLNKVVKVFTNHGKYLRTIGSPGKWRLGTFDYPTDVDVAADGRMLVADSYNHRVQLFNAQGHAAAGWGWNLFWLWPRPAKGASGFSVTTGVAWGPRGRLIHVADSGNHRIVMLDRHGAYVNAYRIKAQGNGFETPPSIAVSPDGSRVYAADIANNRVLVLVVETNLTTERIQP